MDKPDYFFSSDQEISPEAKPAFVTVEKDVLGLDVEPGVVLRPVFAENMTMSFVYMQPHSVAPMHSHPQEQMGTVVEGAYEFHMAGEKRMIRKGEVYVVPPNVPHAAYTYDEPCLAIDVFSPPRTGFQELMEHALREQAAAGATGADAKAETLGG